jgi:hypothetical protein
MSKKSAQKPPVDHGYAVRTLFPVQKCANAPTENNWLLNPQHPHFREIKLEETEPLHYDPRLQSPKTGETRK